MTKEKKAKEKVSKKDGKKTSFLDKINTNKVKNIVTNKYLVSSGALTLNIFIIEMYLRFLTDGSFNDFGVVRIFISSLIIGMSISWILHFFKRIIVRIINAILIGVIGIYAFVELLLYNLIGFYMGIGNADQGTKVGEFVESTLKTMNLLHASLLIVTIIVVLVYIFSDIHIYKKDNKPKKRKFGKALLINMIPLLVIGLLCAFYYHTVRDKKYQSELQADSNYSLWLYPENSNLTVNNYGVVVYIFLDIKNQVTGITSEDILLLENKELEEKPQEEEPVTDYTRIIDDTAWKTLIDNTTNSTYNAVNNYLINRSITPKNEYTGLFKGKNLIIILMESVNEIAIYNKDYFPTLYKMYN